MKKRIVQWILVTAISAGPAFAQSATGTVRGTVTDPSGALVPQATITISNTAGFSRSISSSAAGSFDLSRLVPGRYSLTVKAKGFGTARVDDIEVFGDKVTPETIKLDVSAEAEVQVTAENPGLTVSP